MSVRAVIFDVYKTILEVGPPPSDREEKWRALARDWLGAMPRLELAAFAAACEQVIAREHALARAAGISHPEIYWPDVATEVLPELGSFSAETRADFLFQQQSLFRSVQLAEGASDVITWLRDRGMWMGIASNAQPYTLRELEGSLQKCRLSSAVFTRELCFWSFEHGFSKPDPHVFRLLSARLRARGVRPDETLMVGDRADNDIEPARAQNWQTWKLVSAPQREGEGDWNRLREFIAARV